MIGLKYLYAMLAGAFSGQPALNLRGRRPTGSDLRNPADPVQARRIEAAAAKRARRAEKARDQAGRAWMSNYAHHRAFAQIHDETQVICPLSLNPFYVAK